MSVSQPGHLHVAEVGDAHGGQAAAGHQDEAAAADAVGSEALLRGSGAGSGSAAGSAPPHPLAAGRAPGTGGSRGSTPTRPPPPCPSAGRAGPRTPWRPPRAAGPRSPGNRRFLRPPRAIAAPAPLGSFRRALRLRSAVPMAAAPPAAPRGPRFEPPGGLSGASGTGRGRRAGAGGGAGVFPSCLSALKRRGLFHLAVCSLCGQETRMQPHGRSLRSSRGSPRSPAPRSAGRELRALRLGTQRRCQGGERAREAAVGFQAVYAGICAGGVVPVVVTKPTK